MADPVKPVEPGAQTRYAKDDLLRLNADPEFQRRVSGDAELARLFNPKCNEAEVRAELAASLGMSRRVAGVDLAPVTLGAIGLLTVTGNEFAKSKRDWSAGFGYQLGQLTEALFVLSVGPKAVAAFGDCFRYKKTLDAWRRDASTARHIADACLEAERKIAESLRLWDAAVMAWGVENVKLEGEESFLSAMTSLDDWIGQGLDGFKLFPQTETPKDAEGNAAKSANPFGLMQSARRSCARLLVKFARRLILPRSAGRCR